MLYVGLIHWPCMDKNGEEIATAITNLDLHDLARVCLTYGINTLYIVHPNDVQLSFAKKIMDHWLLGFGGVYNPVRKRAFEVITLVKDIEEIKRQTGAYMVGTSAHGFQAVFHGQMQGNLLPRGTCACCSEQGGAWLPGSFRASMP